MMTVSSMMVRRRSNPCQSPSRPWSARGENHLWMSTSVQTPEPYPALQLLVSCCYCSPFGGPFFGSSSSSFLVRLFLSKSASMPPHGRESNLLEFFMKFARKDPRKGSVASMNTRRGFDCARNKRETSDSFQGS
eukprot:2725631-Pyramimonas_sp.AAC.1